MMQAQPTDVNNSNFWKVSLR